jgi:hypothetical protein
MDGFIARNLLFCVPVISSCQEDKLARCTQTGTKVSKNCSDARIPWEIAFLTAVQAASFLDKREWPGIWHRTSVVIRSAAIGTLEGAQGVRARNVAF